MSLFSCSPMSAQRRRGRGVAGCEGAGWVSEARAEVVEDRCSCPHDPERAHARPPGASLAASTSAAAPGPLQRESKSRAPLLHAAAGPKRPRPRQRGRPNASTAESPARRRPSGSPRGGRRREGGQAVGQTPDLKLLLAPSQGGGGDQRACRRPDEAAAAAQPGTASAVVAAAARARARVAPQRRLWRRQQAMRRRRRVPPRATTPRPSRRRSLSRAAAALGHAHKRSPAKRSRVVPRPRARPARRAHSHFCV